MKRSRLLLFFPVLALYTFAVHAEGRVLHPEKERQKQVAIDARADEIPLFTSKPDDLRPYDILGTVQGWDILNKGKKAVFLQMRRQALTLKADAITDVSCKTVAKAVAQSCQGFAVKWK